MDKKLREFSMLILTGASVLVILLQYSVPLTLEQTQLLYVFDLIIVGVLAADFYSRARKEVCRNRYLGYGYTYIYTRSRIA